MSEPLRFDGRVAIVTGAGRGLGRAHALALAARGAAVVVNDLGVSSSGTDPDPRPAQAVAREITDAGGSALAETGDVGDPGAAGALVGAALDAFGRLDIVVNNAGILHHSPFPDCALDDFSRHLRADPIGSLNVVRAAWPHLREQGYGRIVLSSSTAFLGEGTTALGYVAGKGGAVVSVGRTLGQIGEPLGIRVNTITPFGFSRMVSEAPKFTPADIARRERLGPPAAVSAAVLALAHEHCPSSGGLYNVGNGRITRFFVGETRGFERLGARAEDLLEHFGEILEPDPWELIEDGAAGAGVRMYGRIEALAGESAR